MKLNTLHGACPFILKKVKGIIMEKHYVGSEIGQLRSVMLHRPNLSLKRLTPSNCQELLFDDVLSVERAGEEHDICKQLREQGVEVLLLTDLLTQTLDISEAKAAS